jgi:hypothetical protein
MKLFTFFDYFILFIIIIKFIFIFTTVSSLLLTKFHIITKYQYNLDYWKERTEFIFDTSMAILLIYYFRPNVNIEINKESRLLFYLFGIVLLITSNWNYFFSHSPWKIIN